MRYCFGLKDNYGGSSAKQCGRVDVQAGGAPDSFGLQQPAHKIRMIRKHLIKQLLSLECGPRVVRICGLEGKRCTTAVMATGLVRCHGNGSGEVLWRRVW